MATQAGPRATKGLYVPAKAILIPLAGRVDVSELIPLINHPYSQRLLDTAQLGLAWRVKPGGAHKRFEHALGVLHNVRLAAQRLGIQDPALFRALEVHAFIHDHGHGPFSHETEQVLQENHKDIGRRHLHDMRSVISQVADFDLVEALFTQRDPLSALVHDKNLGADKIDYLARDAHHTGYELGLNTSTILTYLQFDGTTLGVEEKVKEEVIRFQHSFLTMYLRVYLDKTSKQLARLYQRALTEHLLEHPEDSGSIWGMTDTQVMALLAHHPLMLRLHDRRLFKTTWVLKVEGCEREERIAHRYYSVMGLPEEAVRVLSAYLDDPQRVLAAEEALENYLHIPRHHLAIVQPNGYDSILPKDVALFSVHEKRFTSLFDRVPSHLRTLQEARQRGFFIRVAVDPGYAEQCAQFDFLGYFESELLPKAQVRVS
ncbi:MAG: HD domain-containing protein [Patescibacteria group bacterium]